MPDPSLGSQKFTVTNTANIAKTYTLSHVAAGTAVTFSASFLFWDMDKPNVCAGFHSSHSGSCPLVHGFR
jgi:hypothetical protein